MAQLAGPVFAGVLHHATQHGRPRPANIGHTFFPAKAQTPDGHWRRRYDAHGVLMRAYRNVAGSTEWMYYENDALGERFYTNHFIGNDGHAWSASPA